MFDLRNQFEAVDKSKVLVQILELIVKWLMFKSLKTAFSEMLGWVLLNRTQYFIIYSFAPQDDPGSF